MSAIFAFKCANCDEIHEGSPSFAFRAPDPFLQQPKQAQAAGHLDSDFCWYEDADGRHFFIRVCLDIPIHGIEAPFTWGVWVSLSEQNFHRYVETYDTPNTDDAYFGWFCNYLPYYPNTYSIKTKVHPRDDDMRPYLELEKSTHPLSVDFHEGISIARAQEIAEAIMHRKPSL